MLTARLDWRARACGLLLLLPLLGACQPPDDVAGEARSEHTAFRAPEHVTITGYSGDAMEPFLSRDGQQLFFNSAGGPTDKDLFQAAFVDATTFAFRAPVGGTLRAAGARERHHGLR
jgi:hypothetical protein